MGQTVATNKKAFQGYHLIDKWECGIVLVGAEVKSVRAGHVNFKDSFARADGDAILLYNLHIEPYLQASFMNPEADRPRKLLLNKKEIKKIIGLTTQRGFLLVPTKIYFNNRGFVKVEIALGKGKKLYDKREDIKKRDINRDISRAMRSKK